MLRVRWSFKESAVINDRDLNVQSFVPVWWREGHTKFREKSLTASNLNGQKLTDVQIS
jgi:hypothetical protein